MIQSFHQRSIRIRNNGSHGGNIDPGSGCCQRHQFQYFLKNIRQQSAPKLHSLPCQVLTHVFIFFRTFMRTLYIVFCLVQGKSRLMYKDIPLLLFIAGYGRENKYHIPFMIICSRHWSLWYLIGISSFPYLGIPLNLTEPENLEHILSVLLFLWRVFDCNWTLWIGYHQFLKSSLYWSLGTIQWLSSLNQVKQFSLVSGSVTEQGNIYPRSSWYNIPHRGPSTLTLGPFIISDHFITTLVGIYTSRDLLLIIDPYEAEPSIYI